MFNTYLPSYPWNYLPMCLHMYLHVPIWSVMIPHCLHVCENEWFSKCQNHLRDCSRVYLKWDVLLMYLPYLPSINKIFFSIQCFHFEHLRYRTYRLVPTGNGRYLPFLATYLPTGFHLHGKFNYVNKFDSEIFRLISCPRVNSTAWI